MTLTKNKLIAWSIHLLTASAAIIGLYTLLAIYQNDYIRAFWLMGVAIFIDAVDGTLARRFRVKTEAPKIDGALLDNIVDYVNYVITPCFLLLIHPTLLPPIWRDVIVGLIALVSAYQFTQADAKTEDNFFKGFPCYWNFTVFYLFFFEFQALSNSLILIALSILVFVPIKYVYPSRMDNLTNRPWLRRAMLLLSIAFGFVSVGMLWTYPNVHPTLIIGTFAYLALYFGFSLYRTVYPLNTESS